MLEGTITGRIPACVIVATQNLLFVCTCDAGGAIPCLLSVLLISKFTIHPIAIHLNQINLEDLSPMLIPTGKQG